MLSCEGMADQWLFVALKQEETASGVELSQILRSEFADVCAAVTGLRWSGDLVIDPSTNKAWKRYLKEAESRGFFLEEDCTWDGFVRREGGHDGFDAIVFAGHASSEGMKFGKSVTENLPVLANLLAQIERLQLLVLNCCTTEPLAAAVARRRAEQRFYDKDRHEIVVFCWSTECSFEGARHFNSAFCRELQSQMDQSKVKRLRNMGPTKKAHACRLAFQKAMEITAVDFRMVPGYEDQNHDNPGVLGEPMLLPFTSTNQSYRYGMLAKYKVADTGIEVMKRLKSITKYGYLRNERHATKECEGDTALCGHRCPTYLAKITTLYQFGEFFGWLHLMRQEDPQFYRNEQIAAVMFSFSGENVNLIETRGPHHQGLLIHDEGEELGSFAKEDVKTGLLTLFKMDIKAISEVMLDPSDPRSVRSYINFLDCWTNPEPSEEKNELHDAFSKLEADVEALARADEPNSESMTRYYVIGNGFKLRRDSNVYRRIAWMHDTILLLVSVLDPSIKREIGGDELFMPFNQMDKQLYPPNQS